MGGRKRRLWLVQTELTVWTVPLPRKNAPASKRYTEAGEFTGYHLKIFKTQSKEVGKNSQCWPVLKAFDCYDPHTVHGSQGERNSSQGWRWEAALFSLVPVLNIGVMSGAVAATMRLKVWHWKANWLRTVLRKETECLGLSWHWTLSANLRQSTYRFLSKQ